MKKIFVILPLLIFSLFPISCKSNENKSFSLNEMVCHEISKIEGYENFNHETINCLSIIFRTNINTKNYVISKAIDKTLLSIVEKTSNTKLKNSLVLNTLSSNWSEIISNGELLEFLKTKNISLANLSSISLNNDNENFSSLLIVQNNNIDFLEFANYFNLKSNKNIKIEKFSSHLKISGYGNTFNYDLDLAEIEKQSNDGLSYDKILKNFL